MQKSRKSKRRRKVSSLVISPANIESPASVVESNKRRRRRRRRRRRKNLSLKKSHLVKRRMMTMMMMMMIEIFLKLKDTLEKLCPLPAFQLHQTSEEVPC
jgi:hypothetical protein